MTRHFSRFLCVLGLFLCIASISGSFWLLVRRGQHGEVGRVIQHYRPVLDSGAPTVQVPAPDFGRLSAGYEERGRLLASHQLMILAAGTLQALLFAILLRVVPLDSRTARPTLSGYSPDRAMD